MITWIKKLWNDPVCSNIIASGLTGLFIILGGVISTSFKIDGILSLLKINIPLWILILGLFLFIFIKVVLSKIRRPSFLDFVYIENLYGFNWSWKWKFNKKTKCYEIYDLKPLCKTCGERLNTTMYSRIYQCMNMHQYSSLDIEWSLAMTTIQDKVEVLYKNDANKYFKKNDIL